MRSSSKNYREQLSLDEIREIQLNILKSVADFCDKNNIKYFLCAGTMLGAIRHKGFIPWDDDVDIMIPRPDYERLKNNFSIPDLKFYDHEIIPEFDKPYGKISDLSTIVIEDVITDYHIGVNIDVFPIDGTPADDFWLKIHLLKIKFWRNILNLKQIKISKSRAIYKNFFLVIGRMIFYVVPKKSVIRRIISQAKRFSYISSRNSGIIVWGYGRKEVMDKIIFEETIDVQFENNTYNGHKFYDQYLRNLYGNYMQLPPVEKQITHHKYKAYKLSP